MRIGSKIPSLGWTLKVAAVAVLAMYIVFKVQPIQKVITGLNDN